MVINTTALGAHVGCPFPAGVWHLCQVSHRPECHRVVIFVSTPLIRVLDSKLAILLVVSLSQIGVLAGVWQI